MIGAALHVYPIPWLLAYCATSSMSPRRLTLRTAFSNRETQPIYSPGFNKK